VSLLLPFALQQLNLRAVVGTSTRWAMRLVNVITVIKILALALSVISPILCLSLTLFTPCNSMIATGAAVLAGYTPVRDPWQNFRDPFQGSTSNPSSLATALLKINYSLVGSGAAYSVLSE